MKKSKKLLSVLLAVLMAFSVMIVPVSAAIPIDTVDPFDKLVSADGLSSLVNWLLNALNNRKNEYLDTVLNFVCTYVEDINAYVEPEGADLFNSEDTAKKATFLLDYLDALLEEMKLQDKLPADLINTLDSFRITVNLRDINGILATIGTLNGVLNGVDWVANFGDIEKINLKALLPGGKTMSRSDENDINIVKNLIQFLADNSAIFQKFLKGNLELGVLHDVAGLGAKVNSFAGDITPMIEDMVYTSLLGAPDESSTFAESEYQDWTMDQVLVGALYKMLTGTAPEADRAADMQVYLNSNIYSLLTANADKLYNKFLLSLLNEDVIPVLKDFAIEHEIDEYFNFNNTFTASEFNFAGAQNGILGEFNNVLVALLNKLLAQDVLDKIKLEKGDNSKLNANLEKVIKFILPKVAEVVDPAEFDFSKYTEEFVKDKELDYLAVDILKIFFPGWFKLGAEDIAVVNQMDTMGEVATMAVYYALKEFNPVMFEGGYDYVAEWDKKIFDEDGNINDLGNSYWGDIMLSMAVDAAFYGLALNGDNFSFDYKVSDIATKKNAGWGYAEFLGAIADWGIGMVKGLPAVTDKLPGKAEYGPFYEVNVLLNELIDWSFLSNCSNGAFKLDIETLVFDGILNNVYEFDIAGILGLFAVNDKAGNILKMKTAPAILSVVDRLLTALFENNHTYADAKVDATCDEAGHKVKACTKCGVYDGFSTIDPTGHAETEVSVQNASCLEGGIQRITCSKCDYVLRKKTPALGHGKASEVIKEGDVFYNRTYCPTCKIELSRTAILPPDSIRLDISNVKVEYELNSDEKLNIAGLVVYEIYEGDREYRIDTNSQFFRVETELDTSVAGKQSIVVSYLGKQASFYVTVVDKNAAPEPIQSDIAFEKDGTLIGLGDTKMEALLAVAGEGATLKDKNGIAKAAESKVGTGDILTLADGTELIVSVLGDINGDGLIATSDARLALRKSVKLENFTDAQIIAAKVDGAEGDVEVSHARKILRASVDLENAEDWFAQLAG